MQIEDFIMNHPFPSATTDLKDPTLHPARRRWVTELARAVRFSGLDLFKATAFLNRELRTNQLESDKKAELFGMFESLCENLKYPSNFPARLYSFAQKFEVECGGIRTHAWCPEHYAKFWICCIVLGREESVFSFARNAFSDATREIGYFAPGSVAQFVKTAKKFQFLTEVEKGYKFGSPTKFMIDKWYDRCIFHHYFHIGENRPESYEGIFRRTFLTAFSELRETIAKEHAIYESLEDHTSEIEEYLNSNIVYIS